MAASPDATLALFRAAQRSALQAQAQGHERDLPYQDAAAVLDRFDPDALRPVGGGPAGWGRFLDASTPVGQEGNWWSLRDDIRAESLGRLGSRAALAEALAANPDRPDTPAQRALDALVAGDVDPRPAALAARPRAELAALFRAAEWLAPVLDDAGPVAEGARQALARADVLAPMQRLSCEVFVGRDEELQRLRSFVAEGEPGAILAVWGPGGIGKSALLSRFILAATAPEGDTPPLPVAYLDLDRVRLDLTDPTALLLDAADQLARQLPEWDRPVFEAFRDRTGRVSRGLESFELSKSSSLHEDDVAHDFGHAVWGLDGPVLLVVDTFEEAQYLGVEVAYTVWDLLERAAQAAPNLRVVVSGRVEPVFAGTLPLPLSGLPDEPARALVRSALPAGVPAAEAEAFVEAAVAMAEGNPLTLRLAAELAEEGVEALRTAAGRAELLGRVAAEGLQARLYGRVLSHIHSPEVQALAHPGLLVRRIDADVIREVLAEPCGIATPVAADELVAALEKEVALVERDPADGSLRHRQDVRRIMLKDLGQQVPPAVARDIHDRAVAYYGRQAGPVARAEELYHRLMRGDGARALGQRWTDEAGALLRGALDDLPDEGRLWLSAKLGVTPSADLVARASLREREAFVAQQAERYLRGGLVERALGALRDLPDRTPTSPLTRIESEVLRALGRFDEAAALLLAALPAARVSGDADHLRDLLLQLAQVYEVQDRLDDALAAAREGLDRAAHVGEPAGHLRALVLVLRLLRKLGDAHDEERAGFIDEATALMGRMRLQDHPALLRELAAEVGHVTPGVLDTALDTIGVEATTEGAVGALAAELSDWDDRLRGESDQISELAQRAGLQEGSRLEWEGYLAQNVDKLGREVRSWRATLSPDARVDKAIVQSYRDAVDATLKGGTF